MYIFIYLPCMLSVLVHVQIDTSGRVSYKETYLGVQMPFQLGYFMLTRN